MGFNANNQAPAFVKVVPPLPFILNEGVQGFVLGLSQSSLQLRVVAGTLKFLDGTSGPNLQRTHQLAISGEDGVLHRLNVFAHRPTTAQGKSLETELTAKAADETSVRGLNELLTVLRKNQHINICQSQDVEATDRYTGFSDLSFVPKTIPELNWSDLDISCSFLGRKFAAPLLITGMTGGIEKGTEINRRLALAAARFGIPMGVGSQRIAVENAEHAKIFAVKKYAPDLFCIANLGAAQITGPDAVAMCQTAIDMIDANALAIHVNILQEAVQVEGDRSFQGLFDNIQKIAAAVSVPIVVKEVGAGMDVATASRLFSIGVQAIDVGGKGGTSWSYIEGQRSSSATVQEVASAFRDWGIPTAYSLSAVAQAFPGASLTATGGIRDGITVAKAVALGAKMAGIGLPLFRAALESEDGPTRVLESLVQQLKTTMLCTGARTLADLRSHLVVGRPYQSEWDRFKQTLKQGSEA